MIFHVSAKAEGDCSQKHARPFGSIPIAMKRLVGLVIRHFNAPFHLDVYWHLMSISYTSRVRAML